jgi:hypothetical protein
VEGMREMECSG